VTRAAGDLRVFETPQDLAEGVADAFATLAQDAIGKRGSFAVALAGGTTPKAAYALLGREPYASQIDWPHVQIFFGDERCVSPDDAESNYNMARTAFLSSVRVPADNVHRMHGEDDPAQAARDYAETLIEFLGPDTRFDLLMLGMGPDGHTASLFPGSDPRTDEAQLVRAVWVQKMQTHRITLTPAVINRARHVIIATEGAAKAQMLHTVRGSEYDPVRYPVQIVKPDDGVLEWFVDRAAASKTDITKRYVTDYFRW